MGEMEGEKAARATARNRRAKIYWPIRK